MTYRTTWDGDPLGPAARLLLVANAAMRVAYGAGALFSPATMGRLELAADTPERPDARLFVRAFGGHMIGVGTLGLVALRRRRLERAAACAAVAIDVLDVSSAVVEAARRGRLERDLVGGIAVSAAGAITAAMALR
jgi:hypothetical protein